MADVPENRPPSGINRAIPDQSSRNLPPLDHGPDDCRFASGPSGFRSVDVISIRHNKQHRCVSLANRRYLPTSLYRVSTARLSDVHPGSAIGLMLGRTAHSETRCIVCQATSWRSGRIWVHRSTHEPYGIIFRFILKIIQDDRSGRLFPNAASLVLFC